MGEEEEEEERGPFLKTKEQSTCKGCTASASVAASTKAPVLPPLFISEIPNMSSFYFFIHYWRSLEEAEKLVGAD